MSVKLIEIDEERAKYVEQTLKKSVVLCGDALDSDILNEANIAHTESVIAVTNDDEDNVLSSLLAKRQGAKRVITLVNNTNYRSLITNLGIDVVVTPRDITVSTILKHVRRGRIRSVHSLREGVGEIIELEALETSQLVGQKLEDIELPLDVIIGAIVREDEVLIPSGSTVIKENDLVVLFAAAQAVKKVEKMFSVRLEYF
jgi:trk system potassium uptake protein TrkA